jgi:uncharacterized protein (TIGR03790 family)
MLAKNLSPRQRILLASAVMLVVIALAFVIFRPWAPRPPQGILGTSRGPNDWWQAGGATGCVAAYQPYGATSLAASYSNLANPGTYAAAPGDAPTWDGVNGWVFNGTTDYLTTGITPTGSFSAIVMYSYLADNVAAIQTVFGSVGATATRFSIRPRTDATNNVTYGLGALGATTPEILTGTLAIAGSWGYREGITDTNTLGGWSGTGAEIYIGARNSSGPGSYASVHIQALAVYSTTLTHAQIAAITTAMEALDDATPTPTATAANTPTPTNTSTPSNTPAISPTPGPTATSTPCTLILQPDDGNGIDTLIRNTQPDVNFGAAASIGAGNSTASANNTNRALIKFDLSSIPSDATIIDATLSLWQSTTGYASTGTILDAHLMLAPWVEGEATWDSASSGVAWAAVGASDPYSDSMSMPMGTVPLVYPGSINTRYDLAFDPGSVQWWTAGTKPNYGILLQTETEADDLYWFWSSDNTIAATRPRLWITYTCGTPSTPTPTTAPSATPVGTATYTPTPSKTPTPTATATVGVPPNSDAAHVLVVVAAGSADSSTIGWYYKNARNIPSVNVMTVTVTTLPDVYGEPAISYINYVNQIRNPIRAYITNNGLHNQIDYIVLTKGCPLTVDANGTNWIEQTGYSMYGYEESLASAMTLLDSEISPTVGLVRNPYSGIADNREIDESKAINTTFHHSDGYPLYESNYVNHAWADTWVADDVHLYLVTRLDGYTVQTVKDLIDRSVASDGTAPSGLFVIARGSPADVRSVAWGGANDYLESHGFSVSYSEAAGFLTGTNVIGWLTWGSNNNSYTLGAYQSNQFRAGAIAESLVSTSGRSFDLPPVYGQSLVADLILTGTGVTAMSGYVQEPGARTLVNGAVLLARYTSGYNVAESFYMASAFIFGKMVVIGDPLTSPYGEVEEPTPTPTATTGPSPTPTVTLTPGGPTATPTSTMTPSATPTWTPLPTPFRSATPWILATIPAGGGPHNWWWWLWHR